MNCTVPAPPSSPFTTCFSGNARENRERLRNIFVGGHKRSGRGLLALSVLAMLFCCFYLVSCQQVPSDTEQEGALPPSTTPAPSASPAQEEELPPSTAPTPSPSAPAQGLELAIDLNHNGIPEEIRQENVGAPAGLTFWENGQFITRADSGRQGLSPASQFRCLRGQLLLRLRPGRLLRGVRGDRPIRRAPL